MADYAANDDVPERDTPRLVAEIRGLQETVDVLKKTVRRAETQLTHLNPHGDQDKVPGLSSEIRELSSETVTQVVDANESIRGAIYRLNLLLDQIDA